MNITIISCSLHPQSRSYVLAKELSEKLSHLGAESPLVDLRKHSVPLCGTSGASENPHVQFLQESI